jgi:hypothetical protein
VYRLKPTWFKKSYRALLACGLAAALVLPSPSPASAITNPDMDTTYQWFKDNGAMTPMSMSYYNARKGQTVNLDEAAEGVSTTVWDNYAATWGDPAPSAVAAKLSYESTYPMLHYFRQVELDTLAAIQAAVVTEGAVVWKMYNMGVIVKTPTKTFGIDVNQSDPQAFANILNFAVVSHVHTDHFTDVARLVNDAGRPVYGPSNVGAASIKVPWGTYTPEDSPEGDSYWNWGDVVLKTEGDVSLRFVISYQGVSYNNPPYGTKEPNLITRVTGDSLGSPFTLIHSGDSVQGSHVSTAKNGAAVDMLVVHGGLGTGLNSIVTNTAAGLTVLGHENELGHDPRWDYDRLYTEKFDAYPSSFVKSTTIAGVMGESFDPFRNLSVNAYNTIEAEDYSSMSGIAADPGGYIKNINNSDSASYYNVDFGGGANWFEAKIATLNEDGYIQLRLDSLTGPVIGTTDPFTTTGGWTSWTTVYAPIDPAVAKGSHKLFLKFIKSDSVGIANIDSFKFSSITQAESFSSQSGVSVDAGGYIKNLVNGEYAVYNNVQLGYGKAKLELRAATVNAGKVEVRLGSTTGTLLGTVNVSSTGGWTTWDSFFAELDQAAGLNNLYLVFKDPPGSSGLGLFNIDSFKLSWTD